MGEYDTLIVEGHKQKSCFQRFKFPIIAATILLIALLIVFGVVYSSRLKNSNKSWESQISGNNVFGHLQQLQVIATNNSGNRAAATPGYDASVEYVVNLLKKHTDYNVTVQPFQFTQTVVVTASDFTVDAPDNKNYTFVYGKDYVIMGSGPSGQYNLVGLPIYQAVGYGCSPDDYAAVQPGSVALVSRGNCTFQEKAVAADTKNPYATIMYNEGNSPDRMGLLIGATVSGVNALVLTTTYYAGIAMVGGNLTGTVATQLLTKDTTNIIADTKVGHHDRVIVVGSHLDSVPAGPGINDNGSGSALNIELAIRLASSANQKKIKNKIRFCWFGAEELGLLGSHFYVNNLNATDKAELANIAVNLNFDMIGSPNFMRGVYNGSSDTSSNGSAVVQRIFNDYYASQDLAVVATEFTGRSDYGPFLAVGIPAGGLFTGAEVVKSMEERLAFGGLAGAAYDPCYHQACDTIDNINKQVLEEMSKGAAHVLETLATQEDLRKYLSIL